MNNKSTQYLIMCYSNLILSFLIDGDIMPYFLKVVSILFAILFLFARNNK